MQNLKDEQHKVRIYDIPRIQYNYIFTILNLDVEPGAYIYSCH